MSTQHMAIVRRFNKSNLKKTNVTVMTEDGKVFIESKTDLGEYKEQQITTRNCGYVVDNKPDLQIAKVRPNLYLSSQDVARSLDILQENRITHILNLASIDNLFTDQFIYKSIEIYDTPTFDIRSCFDEIYLFINDCVTNGGSVLVHCNAGVSRASTAVISYLIKAEKLPLEKALKQLKTIRPKVSPNSGFMFQLKRFEKEILPK